jgi:uncharacterized protein DUF2804
VIGYRGDGSGRPADLPLPPSRAPLRQGRVLHKHWRYVGVWTETLSLCAAVVHVGPAVQEFWAVWDRERGVLTERTRSRTQGVRLSGARLLIRDGAVRGDVELLEGGAEPVEVVTPVGAAWTWTRKELVRAEGLVTVQGRRLPVLGPALVDSSAGYHPRETRWRWSAGAGRLVDGREVAWNLVVGLNDTPPYGENTVWVDGRATAVGPVGIDEDLATVRAEDGGVLHVEHEAERRRTTNLLLVRSSYRQPFGRFTGRLPGGWPVTQAYGVMEDHSARW